ERLTTFLNDYMESKRILERKNPEEFEKDMELKKNLFKNVTNIIFSNIFNKREIPEQKFKSKALLDALYVGVAQNYEYLSQLEPNKIIQSYFSKLTTTDEFTTNLE